MPPSLSRPKNKIKLNAWRDGHRGEFWAAVYLRLKRYRIVARRVKTPVGEIDIVARRGGTLAIIEVKARPSQDLALDAVPQRARRRLRQAASIFLQKRPSLLSLAVRFDLMVVTPFAWPRHIAGAWTEDAVIGR